MGNGAGQIFMEHNQLLLITAAEPILQLHPTLNALLNAEPSVPKLQRHKCQFQTTYEGRDLFISFHVKYPESDY